MQSDQYIFCLVPGEKIRVKIPNLLLSALVLLVTSRKHLHTKVTPDFHLTYSKNGGNLGSKSK